MKPNHTQPIIATPKRPARLSPFGLSFAHLASLPSRPASAAKPSPAANTTKRPATTAKPARPAPVKASKPAPVSFAHLSGVRLTGPILTPTGPKPAATARPAPKADRTAVDAGWDRALRRAASPVPVTEAGTDAAAQAWDKLMQAAMGHR
jgi:hypothetical protein